MSQKGFLQSSFFLQLQNRTQFTDKALQGQVILLQLLHLHITVYDSFISFNLFSGSKEELSILNPNNSAFKGTSESSNMCVIQ